ncbi:winged helix-turn-helix domain-containing protein [Phytoactinopolyspora halotolerans]|uniref:Helix-turn-helix transcriptional regulator n=1 Tax=Phytoactinopolyspora halotolerans TaxID=1981512 RepID=A0A6L9SB63_9ACTN|nr:helix-turn-helix domain-containing protein [Phytoactinopolyspora halotolerans]NEE02407.1 helix-turn-helix transcriptional regulator [Phytoactinopolyspora halotolerans]
MSTKNGDPSREGPESIAAAPHRQYSLPSRVVDDPNELRAYSHPVRVALTEQLYLRASATATELAELIHESPANCSWHLRQLAKHGIIEEAGIGPGRQRRWRMVPEVTLTPKAKEQSTELARAAVAANAMRLDRDLAGLRAWWAMREGEPPEWQDASMGIVQSWAWLTAEELEQFRAEFLALMDRHLFRTTAQRRDPERRPPDARPVRVVAWTIPWDTKAVAAGEGATDHSMGGPDERRSTRE